jgi:hypothetical protein
VLEHEPPFVGSLARSATVLDFGPLHSGGKGPAADLRQLSDRRCVFFGWLLVIVIVVLVLAVIGLISLVRGRA